MSDFEIAIEGQPAKSFADPETHFRLPCSQPGDSDGCHVGEPTGEVECMACGRRAMNVDEIPHTEDCPQRFVHSEFYEQHTRR